ncbi:MAG: hypothetical protein ACYS26_17585 [Planctomycetota bacterium]|jgi:hypothetical protein
MPAIKVQAAGVESPWEAINVTKTPSSGTPSSYLDGVVLDATGLEGWVVGDANGRMTSFSDDGSKISIVQNAGSLGNEDWGLCNDAHYNGGTYVRYPQKIDGEFSIEVEFSISNAGAGNFCIGVAAWQEEAAVSADTPAMYSGFGRLGSTTLTNPRCHLSGLNGATETDTDTFVSYASGATLKARLQVDSDGKCRMFFTHGGVEYEHNATSNDFKATVGGSHYVGIVTYANVSGTTFEIKSVALTANARTATDKGEKVLYDADLASESAQDMQAGGNGDYAIGGASWTFGNMANADQMELDGSTGLVFDINSGEVDASTETAPYPRPPELHDLGRVGVVLRCDPSRRHGAVGGRARVDLAGQGRGQRIDVQQRRLLAVFLGRAAVGGLQEQHGHAHGRYRRFLGVERLVRGRGLRPCDHAALRRRRACRPLGRGGEHSLHVALVCAGTHPDPRNLRPADSNRLRQGCRDRRLCRPH